MIFFLYKCIAAEKLLPSQGTSFLHVATLIYWLIGEPLVVIKYTRDSDINCIFIQTRYLITGCSKEKFIESIFNCQIGLLNCFQRPFCDTILLYNLFKKALNFAIWYKCSINRLRLLLSTDLSFYLIVIATLIYIMRYRRFTMPLQVHFNWKRVQDYSLHLRQPITTNWQICLLSHV